MVPTEKAMVQIIFLSHLFTSLTCKRCGKHRTKIDFVSLQNSCHANAISLIYFSYWLNEFEWSKQEKILNKFKHYTAMIDGIEVHFVHVKPSVKTRKVVPIMLIHGWPGHFLSSTKLFPLFTEKLEDDFTIEVICPSLPGYIFSEAPHKSGLEVAGMANLFRKLMARLGHSQYYVQGGGLGISNCKSHGTH